MDFSDALKMGQIGESRIANWLKRRGYNVMPVYEKEIDTGKGPQIFSADWSLVAPDLFVFNSEKVFFVEAKHKTVFSWHRITKKWVTGIDLRHYNDYIKVSQICPCPVWLFFLHTKERVNKRDEPWPCPVGLFGEDISVLVNKENHRHDNWGKSGMVYWSSDVLKKICRLDGVQ